MSEDKSVFINESGINAIPLSQRGSWVTPAIVWAGCEFAISVIMTGGGIVSSFSLKQFFFILLFGLVILTWLGDGINSYLGALTGRTSSVIARASFGEMQSRIIISSIILINLLGWWAIQTAITGNAICTMFNIDYNVNTTAWVIMTIIAGILFAIPPIIGYQSMAWTDYIAVPGGIILCISGFYLAIKGTGFSQMWALKPQGGMSFTQAISLVVGANVSQWVIMADYTRFCKPKIKDALLVPIGVVIVGFLLFTMGAVMGIGKGSFDIVAIMKELGFGWWGFLILWLAQWTSQLVCVYSMGLCLCNIFNAKTDRQRKYLTGLGSVLGLILALGGMLGQYQNFLFLTALLFPAVGSILATDYFLIHDREWEDKKGWNWIATVSMVIGIGIGYYTQYIKPLGIPAIQSYIVSGGLYYTLTYAKAQVKPDIYSPDKWKKDLTEA